MDGTQEDALAERFFSQPPVAWEIDWHAEPMSSLERVAMLTTVAPLMAVLAVAVTLLITEPLVARSNVHSAAVEPWIDAVVAVAPQVSEPVAPIVQADVVHEVESAEGVQPIASVEPRPKRAALTAIAKKTAPAANASLLARARTALGAGDAAFARELAQLAVQAAPEDAAAYIVLGGAYDKLGDRARMHATFRACAERAHDPLAQACKALAR